MRSSGEALDDVHTPLSVAAERRRSRLSEDGRERRQRRHARTASRARPSAVGTPFSCEFEEEVEAGDARVFLEFAQDPRPRRAGRRAVPARAAHGGAERGRRRRPHGTLLARLPLDGTITEADAPDASRLPLERPALQAAKALVPAHAARPAGPRERAGGRGRGGARRRRGSRGGARDFETAEKGRTTSLRVSADYFHGVVPEAAGDCSTRRSWSASVLCCRRTTSARALDDQRRLASSRVMGIARARSRPRRPPRPRRRLSAPPVCRGLAATIDGDLAAAHHDADLPSVVEELPFDRQEALAWRAEIKEQQKENLREIQRMCGMDRPPRAAETWMLLSTALRKEPPAKPPRPWGGFKNDDDDDDAESQTSTLPEQPTAALAGDVAKLARERARRNPGSSRPTAHSPRQKSPTSSSMAMANWTSSPRRISARTRDLHERTQRPREYTHARFTFGRGNPPPASRGSPRHPLSPASRPQRRRRRAREVRQ